MRYLYIPFGLVAIFIVYALYLLLIKKDREKFKAMLYPALFFIAIWIVLYYFLWK